MKMKDQVVGHVYRIWCEWDIGQENGVYQTYEDAEYFLTRVFGPEWDSYGFDEEQDLQDVMDEGLVGIDKIEVYGEKEVE